jgi:hypothetical protein
MSTLQSILSNKTKMASISLINHWKAVAEYHRMQLEVAEMKIDELLMMTETEMNLRVIALNKGLAYKPYWKKAVENGLVRNVQRILERCYPDFHNSDVEKTKRLLGPLLSLRWQFFVLKVIEYLQTKGSFWKSGDFSTFDETEGEYHEITWHAANYLLENPHWNPNA